MTAQEETRVAQEICRRDDEIKELKERVEQLSEYTCRVCSGPSGGIQCNVGIKMGENTEIPTKCPWGCNAPVNFKRSK